MSSSNFYRWSGYGQFGWPGGIFGSLGFWYFKRGEDSIGDSTNSMDPTDSSSSDIGISSVSNSGSASWKCDPRLINFTKLGVLVAIERAIERTKEKYLEGAFEPPVIVAASAGGIALSFDASLTANLTDAQGSNATFARGTSASYGSAGGITYVASDVARFEGNGLLMEEARTNKLIRTAEWDNATWIKPFNLTVSADGDVAPDGNTDADSISQDVAGNHQLYQACDNISTASEFVASWYAKSSTDLTAVAYAIRKNGGDFAEIIASTEYITQVTTDSYSRILVPFTSDATVGSVRVLPAQNGNDVGHWYGWGAQLERGEFATSYIECVATSVDRSADFLFYDDDTALSDGSGSLYLEYTPLFSSDNSVEAMLINVTDAQTGPLYVTMSTQPHLAMNDGTNTVTYNPGFVRGTTNKIAARWDSGTSTMQIVVDGSAGTSGTYDGAFARTAGKLYLAATSTGFHANGNIRNVKIWNGDRGQAALVSVTT